jgi:aspartyl-tRNA(Asn)/glutamyl-tRNA(Gln) amidotransferase subunit A
MNQVFELTASKIASDVRSGKTTAVDVAKLFVDRTKTLSTKLGTHLFFDADRVMSEARAVDARAKNEMLPLAGVPVLVKDNICTQGMPTTCASKILESYIPPYDATVVQRLRAAGAVVLGKANLDEFAMGSSNENSAYGVVRNPWNLDFVPGGSSGGSAAAVAAALAPVALGTDTGGSIRQPASLCGVVGLKPSYGRVSRYGLVAFGSSLDQIGPIVRTVEDAALVYEVMSGHDPRDSTSFDGNYDQGLIKALSTKPERKLRIGIIKELLGPGLAPDVRRAVDEAIKVYQNLGMEVGEASIPKIDYSIAAYYVVATAEASANLARFDGIRYGLRVHDDKETLKSLYKKSRSRGFGKEVKQRIMLGTFVLSSGYYDAFYNKAVIARELIKRDFDTAFKKFDLLVSPTSPTTAFKIGEKSSDPLAMYLSDIGTLATNLAGLPGISVPCGFDSNGLPIGLQLMAPMMQERTLLQGAYLYEQSSGWTKKHPNIG